MVGKDKQRKSFLTEAQLRGGEDTQRPTQSDSQEGIGWERESASPEERVHSGKS